jgi:hypothetical protein
MSADGETLHKALRHALTLLKQEPGLALFTAAEEAAKQFDLGPLDEEWLLHHLKQEAPPKS